MPAADLLARLRALGCVVDVDGGNLAVRPASVLTPELRTEIRERKAGLVLMLSTLRPGHPCGCGLSQWWFRAVRVEGGGLVGDWLCSACHPDPATLEVS